MRRATSLGLALAGAVLALFLAAPAATASDGELLSALGDEFIAARDAGDAALAGLAGADAVQRQYDAARDLQEALRDAAPVSRSCRPLLDAATLYGRAQVMQAEGFDRRASRLAARGRELARDALARVGRTRPGCRPAPSVATPTSRALNRPRSGEAFFGRVEAAAPAGAASASLLVDERVVETTAVENGRAAFFLDGPAGQHDLEVRFNRGGGPAKASNVWLLPLSGQYAKPPTRTDGLFQSRISRLAREFGGYAGVWYQDLRSGESATYQVQARFPAASTVKLGVLIAALRRFGPTPEKSDYGYDLAQLARWSSNLAANRLLAALGNGSFEQGARAAENALHRAGATSSTYPGPYRAGTALEATDVATGGPPLVSERVTTARDLARLLAVIHAAALGEEGARRRSGLSEHEARVALGYLLASEAAGDNLGLIRPLVPARTPIARKEGWLSDARHTAAIVFTPTGPIILVILTYRDGITLGEARSFANTIVRAVRIGT